MHGFRTGARQMDSEREVSNATAIAMKRGYANGEVEDGVKSYQTAKASLKEFERKQTTEGRVT